MEIMNNFNGNIDIILPLYNPNDKVFEAIDSILAQTYKNWHLFIIDDASKNTSLANIKNKYKTCTGKITYFQLKVNKRAAACRNYAIKRGDGDFIAFIDQDDVWLPGKLEQQINYFKNNNVDAVHGNIQVIDNNNTIINEGIWESENQSRREVDWNNLSKEELARKIFIEPNIRIISSLVTRNIFIKVNGFKEQFFGGEDELFWVEIAIHGKIGYIDEIIFSRRIHFNNAVKKYEYLRLIGYIKSVEYLKKMYPEINILLINRKLNKKYNALIKHSIINKKLFFAMKFGFKKIALLVFLFNRKFLYRPNFFY